jgi:hypothetical protein
MIMREKIYRFIFIETQFRPRFFIFLIIAAVALLQIVALVVVHQKIEEGETRKALIVQAPEMESILYPGGGKEMVIGSRPAEPIKIDGKLYALKGVNELDGKLLALINEDVYQEGDTIQDYRIAKITRDSVLFKHIKTGELRILRFGF